MADLTVTRTQYDALINAALAGDTDEVRRIRDLIDKANDIKRYFLYIRWQDVGGTAPRRIELGVGWPEEQTYQLELERPIARTDVDTVLATNAANPVGVQVTPDRNGVVGWTLLDDYTF
jgi:hypothetical protein